MTAFHQLQWNVIDIEVFALNVAEEDQQDKTNAVKAFLLEHFKSAIHIIGWEETKSIHLKGVWKVPVND